jgi:hypothetical protein
MFEFPLEFRVSDYFEAGDSLYRLKGVVVHQGIAEAGH